MSEKENNNEDTAASAEASGGVGATPDTAAPAEAPPKTASVNQPAAPPPAKSSGGSSLPGWLALLLVLCLGAGAAWIVQQGMHREQALQERIAQLESSGAEKDLEAGIAAAESRLQGQLRSAGEMTRQALAGQDAALERFGERIEYQQELLAGFSARDEDTWLRAEAQYLLRLANQRVLMARDPDSAIALLQSADDILRELGDPGLHEVRAATAAEIAALRALPRVDVEGIYLRLSALIEQAASLRIFEAPEIDYRAAPEAADTWQNRLQRGYEQAIARLSEYIVIRRRDVPMQALMDPQWEGLVRQNLRMLLEQSQVALLRGNQKLYSESLERARHWVAQFSETDEAAAAAMDAELLALQAETVAVEMPDLSRSVQALDAAIRQRPEPADAE